MNISRSNIEANDPSFGLTNKSRPCFRPLSEAARPSFGPQKDNSRCLICKGEGCLYIGLYYLYCVAQPPTHRGLAASVLISGTSYFVIPRATSCSICVTFLGCFWILYIVCIPILFFFFVIVNNC